MATSEETTKLRLSEVGRKLMKPPTLVKELLVLLDRVEIYLSLVEQSPSKVIQKVLEPTLKALVSNEFVRHSDVDVRVAVAACLSEITRITAPEVPYNDDQMKEAFQLIVSSFEGLDDNISQSFNKRISILETFARVRLCVVMLDLEFDGLILEMFQHFIKTIREYHPETVFACMENIMIRVIEESELITSDLLFCIMEAVRKDNKEVLHLACKLMTKVIGTCGDKLRPYINMAVITKGLSLTDYGDVVYQLHNDLSAKTDIQSEDSSASAVDTLLNASKSSELMADAVKTAEEIPASLVKPTENICTDGCGKLSIRNGNPADPSSAVRNLDGLGGAKTDVIASLTVGEDPLTADKALDDKEDKRKSKTEAVAKTNNKMQGRKTKAKNCKKTTSEAKLDGNSSSDVKKFDVLAESLKSSNKDVCTSPHQISSCDVADDVSLKPSDNDGVPSMRLSGETKDLANKFSQCSQSKMEAHSLKNHSSGNNMTVSFDCNLEEETISPTVNAAEVEANVSKYDVLEGETDGLDGENLEGTAILSGDAVQEAEAPMILEKEQSSIGKSTDNLEVQLKHGDEMEHGPLKAKNDVKRQGKGLGKATLQNHAVTVEKSNKKSTSTQKSASAMKLVNDEKALKGTPKTITKRKQIEENRNEHKDFGEEQVGSKVKVWWPDDKRYYEGVIKSFNSAMKKHKILYSDGEVEHLVLNKERWEVIGPDEVEDGSPNSKDDIKTRGRGLSKATPQKHAVSAKNNNKVTPKTAHKRKRIDENKNENKDFAEELVGSKVKVWWPDDKRYYEGVIQSFNPSKKTHKVLYSDGEVENLVVKNEKWEVIKPDEESDTEEEFDQEAPDIASGKRRKVEGMSGGNSSKRAHSSKSMSASNKSFKLKGDSKAKTISSKLEMKSKDERVKSAGKLRADARLSSVARSRNRRKSDSINAGPPTIETRSVKKKNINSKITRAGDKYPAMKSAVKFKTIVSTKSENKSKSPKKSMAKLKALQQLNSEKAANEETQSHARETRNSKRKSLVLGKPNKSNSVPKRKKGH